MFSSDSCVASRALYRVVCVGGGKRRGGEKSEGRDLGDIK